MLKEKRVLSPEMADMLFKKYPNDMDLGRLIRSQLVEPNPEAVELLKEVIALHGFSLLR